MAETAAPKTDGGRGMGPARATATGKKIRKSLLGRKVGMTQIFDEAGNWVPVTVLEVGPCTVLQVKNREVDGYSAVQLGFGRRRKALRPQSGLYAKLGVETPGWVREVPFVDPQHILPAKDAPGQETKDKPAAKQAEKEAEGKETKEKETKEKETEEKKGPDGTQGQEAGGAGQDSKDEKDAGAAGGVRPGVRVGVSVFAGIKRVDVRGITKGRGFSGVIRRHHFNAGPKSHGTKNIREPGSTGMHTDPGRVLKGKRMPGHLGAAYRKVRNLRVVKLEPEENLLLVEGAVPGPNGGFVYVEESLKQK